METKNILIVDDDPEDCEFFIMAVEQIHPEIKVSAVNSNVELFLHLEQHTPDYLFIDAFIQHESGLTSIQKIRKENRFQQIPVIMYTGSSDLKNVANAFAAGASAYIVKPNSLAEIKTVLQTVFQQDWEKPMLKQYYLNGKFQVL
jgi:CheY-like chemotaxis protein